MTPEKQPALSRTLAAILGAAIGAGLAIALTFMLGDGDGSVNKLTQIDEGGFALVQGTSLVGLAHRSGRWNVDEAVESYFLFGQKSGPYGRADLSYYGLGQKQTAGYLWPGKDGTNIKVELIFLGKLVSLSEIEALAKTVGAAAKLDVDKHLAEVKYTALWFETTK